MAQFRAFSTLCKPPGSLCDSHNFCYFRNRYGAKLLARNMPHTHFVVSIEFFRKCDIMYYRSEGVEGEKYGYRMYKKAA